MAYLSEVRQRGEAVHGLLKQSEAGNGLLKRGQAGHGLLKRGEAGHGLLKQDGAKVVLDFWRDFSLCETCL